MELKGWTWNERNIVIKTHSTRSLKLTNLVSVTSHIFTPANIEATSYPIDGIVYVGNAADHDCAMMGWPALGKARELDIYIIPCLPHSITTLLRRTALTFLVLISVERIFGQEGSLRC